MGRIIDPALYAEAFDLMVPFAPMRRLNVDLLFIGSIDPLVPAFAARVRQRQDDSVIVHDTDFEVSAVGWRNGNGQPFR